MKPAALLFIGTHLFWTAHAQMPYIRDGSIGQAPNRQPVANNTNVFSPLPVQAWAGEKFVLMPMTEYGSTRGYIIKKTATSDISYLPYARYKGKIITVQQVEKDPRYPDKHLITLQVDETREKFLTTDFLGHVPGWALKRDIDYARESFVGKTLWLRNPEVGTYDAAAKKSEHFKIKNLRPVKVIDIVLSETEGWSLRFILEDQERKQFFKVAKLSGTNSERVLETAYKFNDVFFTENPRKKFDWDAGIFAAIEDGKLIVGMSKEQVRISWGNPLDIKRTTAGSTTSEQWIYGGRRYVYFNGDKLTSIQD